MTQNVLDQYLHLTEYILVLYVQCWINTFTSLSTFLCYNFRMAIVLFISNQQFYS